MAFCTSKTKPFPHLTEEIFFHFFSLFGSTRIYSWILHVRVSIDLRAAHFTMELLDVLRAVCHAWRAFKPILGREFSKLFPVGSPLFCARKAFFSLSASTKTYQYTSYIPGICVCHNSKFTQSVTMTCAVCRVSAVCRVPRVCAVCRASRVACFQTFVLDREHSNLFLWSGVL